MTKRVIVTLTGIKNVATGSDPGANVEIYGDLYARRVVLNMDTGDFQAIVTHQLWHRNGDNPVDISQDSIVQIGAAAPELTIEPGEFLWIGGHLAEEDDWPNANDNLGFIDKKLAHDAIQPGPQPVIFTDNDQKVEAKFLLTVS